jgi:hypothetical protein
LPPGLSGTIKRISDFSSNLVGKMDSALRS